MVPNLFLWSIYDYLLVEQISTVQLTNGLVFHFLDYLSSILK